VSVVCVCRVRVKLQRYPDERCKKKSCLTCNRTIVVIETTTLPSLVIPAFFYVALYTWLDES
jgi:hypothetical protein